MSFRLNPSTWNSGTRALFLSVLFFFGSIAFWYPHSHSPNTGGIVRTRILMRTDSRDSTELIACTRGIVNSQLNKRTAAELIHEVSTRAIPKVYGDCHSVVHIIGEQTYGKYGTMEASLSQCSNACFSGCLHGVMGAAMIDEFGIENPDSDIAHMDAKQIERIGKEYCASISSREFCHGIGHLLYAILEDFGKAAASCSVVSHSALLDDCLTGVYMQGTGGVSDSLVLGSAVPSLARVPDGDYGYPCNAIPEYQEQYRHSCFKYLTPYQEILFEKHSIDDPKDKLKIATQQCESFDMSSRSFCFEGLGRFMPFFVERTGTSTEGLIRICTDLSKASDWESCVRGHIRILRSYTHDDTALAFCTAISSKTLQKSCFESYFSYNELEYESEVRACQYAAAKELCASQFRAYQQHHSSTGEAIR